MAPQTPKTSIYPWLKKYPKDVAWDVNIPVAPVYKILEDSAAKYPDRCAIYFLGKRYTYKDLLNYVNHVAKGLQKIGVKKDVKVGLFMPNSPAFIIFYYAVQKAGGIVVNYSPLYASRELLQQIQDSETEVMVTMDLEALYPKVYEMLDQSCLKKIVIAPLKEQLPFPKNILFPIVKAKEVAKIHWDDRHITFQDLIANDGVPKEVEINLHEDVAVIQYTGGTTGLPKGAMLTHANVYSNVQQANLWFVRDIEEKQKILAALPLFHVFAMTAVMNFGIMMGGEIVLMFPRFNVDEAMKLIHKHKITFFPAVPTIYTMINNHPRVREFNLKSLYCCLSGGAALPVEVKKEFEAMTGCILLEAYGLSETSPAATCNPFHGENKAGSIGIPFPGTRIRIMSLDNPMEEVPLGEKGEICIQGPQVMKGYWKRPVETAQCIVDGLFHSGDVGFMDEDGYTFLVDRIKDVIIVSGFNVYPRNIEEAIYLHSAVEETTVVGVPDSKKGEAVKAFVKLRAGMTITEQEMLDFLKDKLSPYQMPKFVEFRDTLPKTMIGKLSKKELVAEEVARLETNEAADEKAGNA